MTSRSSELPCGLLLAALPPLLFTQPHACAAMLDYRFRVLGAAHQNAREKGLYEALQAG